MNKIETEEQHQIVNDLLADAVRLPNGHVVVAAAQHEGEFDGQEYGRIALIWLSPVDYQEEDVTYAVELMIPNEMVYGILEAIQTSDPTREEI